MKGYLEKIITTQPLAFETIGQNQTQFTVNGISPLNNNDFRFFEIVYSTGTQYITAQLDIENFQYEIYRLDSNIAYFFDDVTGLLEIEIPAVGEILITRTPNI